MLNWKLRVSFVQSLSMLLYSPNRNIIIIIVNLIATILLCPLAKKCSTFHASQNYPPPQPIQNLKQPWILHYQIFNLNRELYSDAFIFIKSLYLFGRKKNSDSNHIRLLFFCLHKQWEYTAITAAYGTLIRIIN